MKGFSDYIRSVSIIDDGQKRVKLSDVQAQYNPFRFKHWKSLHTGPKDQVLNIEHSPHVRFLRSYQKHGKVKSMESRAYYKMHLKYGKHPRWIRKKIKSFIRLFESLKKNPIDDNRISIMKQPLIKNRYNSGYEVFEGHHRIACFCVLGVKEIPVTVLRAE